MKPLAVALMMLCACGGGGAATAETTTTEEPTTTTTEATTTTVDQVAADRATIASFWRAQSDAYLRSTEAGLRAEVDSQYPGTGYTFEGCVAFWFGGSAPEGYAEEHIVDQATIQPDPEWIVPGGPLDGLKPPGRTYIMTVKSTTTEPGLDPTVVEAEAHVTLLDGQAYRYSSCEE